MTPGNLTQASGGGGHDPVVLLFLMLIGLVTIISLIGYVISSVARRGGLAKTAWERCRDLAVLCCCAAIAVYFWGALHVVFLEEESLFEECADAGGRQRALQVDSYQGDYLPLQLTCHLDEGGSFTAAVPGHVNPALAYLAVGTVALGITAGLTRGSVRTTTRSTT